MWAFAGVNAPTSSSWATPRRVSGARVNVRRVSAQTMASWQNIFEAAGSKLLVDGKVANGFGI